MYALVLLLLIHMYLIHLRMKWPLDYPVGPSLSLSLSLDDPPFSLQVLLSRPSQSLSRLSFS